MTREGSTVKLGELEHSERHRYYDYYRCIKIKEVKNSICWICKGMAIGSDEISMNFLKSNSREGIEGLSKLFNIIFRMKKMFKD